MYVIVWRFEVKHVEEFRRHYGPDGTWARFFRRSPGFVRTDLLANHDEYKRIDAGFERLTEREERMGEYESTLGPRP